MADILSTLLPNARTAPYHSLLLPYGFLRLLFYTCFVVNNADRIYAAIIVCCLTVPIMTNTTGNLPACPAV